VRRTLVLRREALVELTGAELTAVSGGHAITVGGTTCPVAHCDLSLWASCLISCPTE
jgi:hypothetical protein